MLGRQQLASTTLTNTLTIRLTRERVMTDKTARGRFVWHELMTADSAAAHAFYSKVLGWKTQPQADDPSYSMFAGPGGPLGGSAALDAGEPEWIPYIGTTDIEATVSEATSRGGAVKKAPTATSNGGGQYAVLADPQGATFGVYASAADPGRDGPPKRGEYSWHELATTDGKAAIEFYTALFGWDTMDEHDMGPIGTYFLLGRNGRPIIGMYTKASEQPGPAWVGYVRVKDLDRTVKKVKSAGGTLTNGPMEVPGGDWIAQFLDPQGAAFAAHVLQSDLQTAATDSPAAQPAESAPAAVEEAEEPELVEEPAASSKPARPARKAAPKKPAAKKSTGKTAQKKKSSPHAAVKAKPAKKAKRAAAKSAKRPARKAAKAAKANAGKKAAAKKSTRRSAAGKTAQTTKKTAKKTAKKKVKTARKAK